MRLVRAASSLRRAAIAALALVAACGERGEAPLVPGFNHNMSLVFEGTLTASCEVQSFQSCADAPFGTGVPVGTPVTLRITYDSLTPRITLVLLDDLTVVRYYSVTAELTVGTTTLPRDISGSTYIEVSASPSEQTMAITLARGVSGGVLAGLSVDFAIVGLRIDPSRYPDVSLPTNASVFSAALSEQPFTIALKHHTDPELSSFGLVAPGALVTGEIRTVRDS